MDSSTTTSAPLPFECGDSAERTTFLRAFSCVSLILNSLSPSSISSKLPTYPDYRIWGTMASLSLAAGLATDITTAAALCYYLQKLRTGIASSDSLVRSLTRYAVNCGVVTSLATLITVKNNWLLESACAYKHVKQYDAFPDTFVFMAFYFLLAKLYSISFLATLNTRQLVRGSRSTDQENQLEHGNTVLELYRSGSSRKESQQPQSLDSKIDTQKDSRTLGAETSYSAYLPWVREDETETQ
ncbi:hypothetical protein HWV62_37462 [Athelia sp. TMB]|nr:hypothetical protein HWV62_37462 [Athelia sp. TMB]